MAKSTKGKKTIILQLPVDVVDEHHHGSLMVEDVEEVTNEVVLEVT